MTKIIYQGRCSTFGGPSDVGMSPTEGLAVYDDVMERPNLFLPQFREHGSLAWGRRLDPRGFYIAMRWDYHLTPIKWLRQNSVSLTNSLGTKSCFAAWPVDWGPSPKTGRIADLSPGLAELLGVQTNDEVIVTVEVTP